MSERGKEQGQRGTDDALRVLGVDPAKAREAPANAEEIIAAQQRGMALIDEVAEKTVRGLDHLERASVCRCGKYLLRNGSTHRCPWQPSPDPAKREAAKHSPDYLRVLKAFRGER